MRGLLAHSDGAYEEWGASGSLRIDPGISGRGVSLTVAPVWGAASGGAEQLWSTGTAAGLAADDSFGAQARLQAELGYGLRPPVGQGVLTPYAGFSAAAAGRSYRLGARWRDRSMFQMALEGSHGEADGDAQPATTATLRGLVSLVVSETLHDCSLTGCGEPSLPESRLGRDPGQGNGSAEPV